MKVTRRVDRATAHRTPPQLVYPFPPLLWLVLWVFAGKSQAPIMSLLFMTTVRLSPWTRMTSPTSVLGTKSGQFKIDTASTSYPDFINYINTILSILFWLRF